MNARAIHASWRCAMARCWRAMPSTHGTIVQPSRRPVMGVMLLGWLVLAGGGFAAADQGDARLDPLFERLAMAADAAEAARLEAAIWAIWLEVADATSTDLLEQGQVAMANSEWVAAQTAFDALVEQRPLFAEGWNKRATLAWLRGDNAASVADIQRTLALEPRHFGALSGLGLIFMATGRNDAALAVFEAALRIHPFLRGAAQHLDQLRTRRGGDPT